MKRIILAWLITAIVPSAFGATEPLGRLFFTPAERAQLDQARQTKQRPPVKAEETPAPPAPEVLSYSGIVRRSDGKSILWLNNRPVDEKEALSGLAVSGRIHKDGAVTVRAHTGRNVDLKVGQSVELTSGNVAESGTRVATTPPAAAPQAEPDKAPPQTAPREAPVERTEPKTSPRTDEQPRPR